MENSYSHLQNFQISNSLTTALESLEYLNEIISLSRNELNFFYETGGLQLLLRLLSTNEDLVHICLKILLNASKRSEKFRKDLVKNNIFYVLSILLKNELSFSRQNLILCTALIVLLVHRNHDAQNQIRTSGCLAYLAYILNIFLVDAETKPLPLRNTELLVYSIIVSNKDPQHLENQTEVGWITPKIVEYLGRQTIFSSSDQIQIVKCFWSFLKSILHKNDFNQRIFLKCSGFNILFRSMQEIVDEKKSEEFGSLLIKMTGVLVRLKSQKQFLYQASTYCSLMILCSLLNTNNPCVVQHVIIFIDSLTQEIPQVLQPATNKHIFQCLLRSEIILLKNNMSTELCQSIWVRAVSSAEIPCDFKALTARKTSLENSPLWENINWNKTFCPIHDSNSLENPKFRADFLDHHSQNKPFEHSKINEVDHTNVWETYVKNRLKGKNPLKLGKVNRTADKKRQKSRFTPRKIIQFFGKLLPFFR